MPHALLTFAKPPASLTSDGIQIQQKCQIKQWITAPCQLTGVNSSRGGHDLLQYFEWSIIWQNTWPLSAHPLPLGHLFWKQGLHLPGRHGNKSLSRQLLGSSSGTLGYCPAAVSVLLWISYKIVQAVQSSFSPSPAVASPPNTRHTT